MTEVHSCSYYCDRPECIKAQRDELRDRLGSMTDREIMQQALEALQSSVPPTYDGFLSHCKAMNHIRIRLAQPEQGGKTGWPAGMLQDDSRELSKALASKPDAKQHAREAAHGIKGEA